MYIFLFFTMIILSGAGYYEYNALQDKVGSDEQKITRLSEKIDRLEADKQKLIDENGKLVKNVGDDQSVIAVLNQQVKSAQLNQGVVVTPTGTTPSSVGSLATGNAHALSATAGNKLGAINTRDGKSYLSCKLLKVHAQGIVVSHSAGIIEIAFDKLPDDLQKRFGYDSINSPVLSAEQVQLLDQQRQNADLAGN